MSELHESVWQAPLAQGPLDATIAIPGSKSLSNRYLILAALSKKPTEIVGLLRSRDTELMIDALRTLGVNCEIDADDETHVTVIPPTRGGFKGDVTIHCGLAGTVMRFVAALAIFARGPVHLDGDTQSYDRPMKPVLDGLEQLGAHVEYEGREGFLPCTIIPPVDLDNPHGDSAHVSIDSSSSSQFISGLLLIGSLLPHGLTLHHEGASLPSMPHIRMTMEDIAYAGGSVSFDDNTHTWVVNHHALDLPAEVTVEPDLSNAAPFLGAALLASGTVRVPHWPAHTTQPGGLLPYMLHDLGAEVYLDDCVWNDATTADHYDAHYAGTLSVRSDGNIQALGSYDMSAAGEIAPSIAALAVFAYGESQLRGIAHLRGHETNRLEALVNEIERVGSHAHEIDDGIIINPVPLEDMHGARMESYADHRMATFAAMLGLRIPDISVNNIETTRKTIPDFTGMWTYLLHQTREL